MACRVPQHYTGGHQSLESVCFSDIMWIRLQHPAANTEEHKEWLVRLLLRGEETTEHSCWNG